MSYETASAHCLVKIFFLIFRYLKFLLHAAFLQRASIAESESKLFSRFKYSSLASGSIIVLSSFWFTRVMLLFEKSNLIISWLTLFIISSKPESVRRFPENWQDSISLDSLRPADKALTYLSPNFCPLTFMTLTSPLFLTSPMVQGKTPWFSTSWSMSVEGSSSMGGSISEAPSFFRLRSFPNFL